MVVKMKITRRQLRKIISEAMYDPMHGMKGLDDPYKSKIMSVIDNPDTAEAELKQFHHLGDTVVDYKDPRPGMPDDSMAGVKRQQEGYLKQAAQEIESYLPGFLNLPKDMIDVVVEFVFLSEGPTLHIQLEEDMIEHELGEDFYHRGAHFQEIQKPENAEIVAMMNDMRENPKAHDVKFYYIYSANASYNGSDPFARIDPHGMGGSQSGYFDGFSEEYKKVTTDQKYVIDSFLFDQAFIQMMRDLRPDHEEEVIN